MEKTIIHEIIELYYNGLSKKSLHKRFEQSLVKEALYSDRWKYIRDYYASLKKAAFLKHFSSEGITRLGEIVYEK